MSGYLRGWLRGEDHATSATWANACGAFAVSRLLCSPEYVTFAELQYFLEGKLLATRHFKPEEASTDSFEFTFPRTSSLQGKRLEARGMLWHQRVGKSDWEQLPLAPAETTLAASPWAPTLKVSLPKYGLSRDDKFWLWFNSNTPHMRVRALDKVIELNEEGYGSLEITPIPGHQTIELTGVDPELGGVVKESVKYFHSGLQLEVSPPTLEVRKREKLSLSVTSKVEGYVTLYLRFPGSSDCQFLARSPIGPGRPLKATWGGILPLTKEFALYPRQQRTDYIQVHVSADYGDETDQVEKIVKLEGLLVTSPFWKAPQRNWPGWMDDLPPPQPWRILRL